jgi:Helicase conserved C-terminal domain
MELRKICNHPYLVKGVEDRILADAAATWKAKDSEGKDLPVDYVKLFGEQLVKSSGKMVLLEKLLLKLFTNGHKVLIFSQMVRVLDLLEELLKISKYRYERLDGSTSSSSRASSVDRFNRASCHRFVMLLSTRAGGLGEVGIRGVGVACSREPVAHFVFIFSRRFELDFSGHSRKSVNEDSSLSINCCVCLTSARHLQSIR